MGHGTIWERECQAEETFSRCKSAESEKSKMTFAGNKRIPSIEDCPEDTNFTSVKILSAYIMRLEDEKLNGLGWQDRVLREGYISLELVTHVTDFSLHSICLWEKERKYMTF